MCFASNTAPDSFPVGRCIISGRRTESTSGLQPRVCPPYAHLAVPPSTTNHFQSLLETHISNKQGSFAEMNPCNHFTSRSAVDIPDINILCVWFPCRRCWGKWTGVWEQRPPRAITTTSKPPTTNHALLLASSNSYRTMQPSFPRRNPQRHPRLMCRTSYPLIWATPPSPPPPSASPPPTAYNPATSP